MKLVGNRAASPHYDPDKRGNQADDDECQDDQGDYGPHDLLAIQQQHNSLPAASPSRNLIRPNRRAVI